jgi:hypothetical protein
VIRLAAAQWGVDRPPDQATFTPGDVWSIPFLKIQIKGYRNEQRQGDQVTGKWSPQKNEQNSPSVDSALDNDV